MARSSQFTENELLEARIQREQALKGLLDTLRDLALDVRDLLRQEARKPKT